MNTPNDILYTKDNQNIDIIRGPTIEENQKKDIQHHPNENIKLQRLTPAELYNIDRRQFGKNYIMVDCPYCGHQHPITRFTYRKIEAKIKHQWAINMNNRLTPAQRKSRAIKAGTQRAINAGQKLRK